MTRETDEEESERPHACEHLVCDAAKSTAGCKKDFSYAEGAVDARQRRGASALDIIVEHGVVVAITATQGPGKQVEEQPLMRWQSCDADTACIPPPPIFLSLSSSLFFWHRSSKLKALALLKSSNCRTALGHRPITAAPKRGRREGGEDMSVYFFPLEKVGWRPWTNSSTKETYSGPSSRRRRSPI